MRFLPRLSTLTPTALAVALMVPASVTAATLQPSTVRAWDAYVSATEARVARELTSPRRVKNP